MTRLRMHKFLVVFLSMVLSPLLPLSELPADSSRYPQFAQQQLPQHVIPSFIRLDQLVEEIVTGKRPLLIDVRSDPEYREAHIKGSISIPLDQFAHRLEEVPRDRLVVLY